ncbi:hypothetical protein [Shinella pollutisoli]|uniref:ABC transporter permease n=1 Tax=Shinella pollutisoli TaxID=2250594 RepID=A0ABV7DCY0_9HYPH|nr:hypothetical protein [Shinella pollutisoli]
MDTYTILSRLNHSANRGALGLAVLASIVAGIIIIADHSLARVERAYEIAGRV